MVLHSVIKSVLNVGDIIMKKEIIELVERYSSENLCCYVHTPVRAVTAYKAMKQVQANPPTNYGLGIVSIKVEGGYCFPMTILHVYAKQMRWV